MDNNYKGISKEFRPYAFIGAISGILKYMDDSGASAEKTIEIIRSELKAFKDAEAANQTEV